MDFKAPQDRVAQNAGMRSEIGPAPTRRVIGRSLALVYGVASYLAFLAAFLYAIGFVGNLAVPKSIDSGPEGLLPVAILVDTLLLLLFAVPHSVMARPAFKKWWTRFIPPPVERSTYVLVSSLTLGLLFWQWRPIPAIVWTYQTRLVAGFSTPSSGAVGLSCSCPRS